MGKFAQTGKRRTRELFESGLVLLNGSVAEGKELIGRFDHVELRGEIVQARTRRVAILNKPSGVVSATVDEEHPTVIDLIDEPWAVELHLAGRLDRYTTGLMVLTNDSDFSESLTEPEMKVGKRYLVTVDGAITPEVMEAFERGIWFAKEKMTTTPAKVVLIREDQCRLTIYEGKHHQVKRMFAGFELKVTALHREAVGGIELPEDLAAGEWRLLDPEG